VTRKETPVVGASPGRELEYLARACEEAAEDVVSIHAGESVSYNLDFDLLCPVLFQNPGAGSKEFRTETIASVRRILGGASHSGFSLVMSGYTWLEFFDQLAHTEAHLRTARPDLYSSVDERLLREQLLTSDGLRQQLRKLTADGLNAQVRGPIDSMTRLLASGVIRGIGDIVDTSAVRRSADKQQFERFYSEHRERRLAGDSGRRATIDSEFHYKIDAANNCLTLAVAEAGQPNAYFVTATPMNLRQLTTRGETYARLDRTPLFVLNAREMEATGAVSDAHAYLKRQARRSAEYAEEVGSARRLRDVPLASQLEVIRHFRDVSQWLATTEPIDVEDIEKTVDDIALAVRDPSGLRERISDAIGDLKTGAAELEQAAAALDLGYVSEFDFRDDPILARVRTQLGLELRGNP
jgi:hypothetical protein